MVKQVKQAKADIYLRDTDSQSLFNNSGELSFKYFHEWNDCYNPTTGETAPIDGEIYDEDTNSYKPNCPEGYLPVFNGRQSALWDNMVSCFPDRIKDMYKTMRNNGLSYSDMFAKYKEFWKLWCENLYNADAFGYANTGNFEKAFGDKLQIMNFFFYKRQRYLDSKYCCGSSVSNTLRLRLSETGNGLAIKYYQALYSSLQWGIGSFATQRNIEPGTYSYQPWGIKNPQDATFDIDDADLITELSTYVKGSAGVTITGLEGIGNFKFDSSMSILKRLTKFIMNYSAAKPNTNELGKYFDLSGMSMLKQVIVRNVKNLTNSIVISSDIIEEIDFTGTPIVGVTTPPSDSLTKLVLPDTIVALKLVGYSKLQNITMAGYSKVDQFEIEDCPSINTYDLLKSCYDAGAPLSQVNLKNIGWIINTLEALEFLLYLARNKAKITGKVTIASSLNVSFTTKVVLMSAFGNIDDPNNDLYITYSINTVTGITLIAKTYHMEAESFNIDILANPGNGNDIKNFTWSIEDNKWATIDQSGTVTIHQISNRAEGGKATVTLQAENSSGDIMTATKEFFFYKRECELGDYLFNDGTYAANLQDNPDGEVVGIIFYLQPKDGKGNRHRALAVNNRVLVTIPYITFGLNSNQFPNLNIVGVDNPYNIEGLDNLTKGSDIQLTRTTLVDLENKNNDGFKVYENNHIISTIGFKTITTDIYSELKNYLDDIELGVGDLIAIGQLNTLYIIKKRDTILSSSSVNLPIPKETNSKTELDMLNDQVKSLVNNNSSTAYSQYYFLPASTSYAYKPKVSVDKSLGLHRWFLASIGEFTRYAFYELVWRKPTDFPEFKNILLPAITNNKLTHIPTNTNTNTWSSNPKSSTSVYTLYNYIGHGIFLSPGDKNGYGTNSTIAMVMINIDE